MLRRMRTTVLQVGRLSFHSQRRQQQPILHLHRLPLQHPMQTQHSMLSSQPHRHSLISKPTGLLGHSGCRLLP
jgi:hypothetical protein